MALGLKDLHGYPATLEQLEAEVAERREQAERSAKDAAEAAAVAERERRQAAKSAAPQLAELERSLAAVLATAPERPRIEVRGRARLWLHGGDPQATSASLELQDLAERDSTAFQLFGLHQAAGRLLLALRAAAGLAEGDELFDRADDLECACWRGLLARVRVLAGEVEP